MTNNIKINKIMRELKKNKNKKSDNSATKAAYRLLSKHLFDKNAKGKKKSRKLRKSRKSRKLRKSRKSRKLRKSRK